MEEGNKDWEREFQKVINEGLVPQIDGSAVCIITPGDPLDAQFAVQLGVMIMLDKPILAIVAPGSPVSAKLRLVADAVVEGSLTNPRDTERIQGEIVAFAEKYGLEQEEEES